MESYWDYELKDRAKLGEDEVRAMLDAELMRKGVLKVDPPKLRKLEPMPEVGKVQVFVVKAEGQYGLRDCYAFSTVEQAQKFVELCPIDIASNYDWGREYEYAKPLSNMVIEQRTFCDYNDLFAKQKVIRENKANKEANDKLTEEYNKAAKEMDSVYSEVWEDWHLQKHELDRCNKVVETYKEYLKITKGSEKTAVQFLLKAFDREQVSKACDWTGTNIDIDSVEEVAKEAAAAE